MIRNQFSYWLCATPQDEKSNSLDTVLNALNTSELAETMVFDISGNEITGELKEIMGGTIEEDESLADLVAAIAARFPTFKFVFKELDEDDRSNGSKTTYAGGVLVYKACIRTIQPDEYDAVTVADIVRYLEEHHWNDAAAAVKTKFQ